MVEQTGAIDVTSSFGEQSHVRNFLNARYEGPVPEGLMRRLHSLSKQAVQQELDRLGLDMKCSGIRLGYNLFEASEQLAEEEENSSEGKPEQHYIECWGCYTQHQKLLQRTGSADENTSSSSEKEDSAPDNFVSREFLDSLLSRVQEKIGPQIPSAALGGKSIQPWLFGFAQSNQASSSDQPIVFANREEDCCNLENKHHSLGTSRCGGKRCVVSPGPVDAPQ